MKYCVCICRGNIARSAFAEKIIASELHKKGLSSTYASLSRGLQGTTVDPEPVKFPNFTYYGKLYEDAQPTLKKFGVDLSSHVSTPIDLPTAEKAHILLAMDQTSQDKLLKLFPHLSGKVYLFSELVDKKSDVIDPEVTSSQKEQEKIYTDIRKSIIEGFPKLLRLLSQS